MSYRQYEQEPIVLIENDIDDIQLFQESFRALGCQRRLRTFSDSESALLYLRSTTDLPFMIVADINMPTINGIQLRQEVRKTKRVLIRCVPFFFLTASFDHALMERCYGMMTQGVFIKPKEKGQLTEIIGSMLKYCEDLVAA